jgi:hypothetical protein
VIAGLAEVARLGMAKSAGNLQFRRYLAAHHQRVETFQANRRRSRGAHRLH